MFVRNALATATAVLLLAGCDAQVRPTGGRGTSGRGGRGGGPTRIPLPTHTITLQQYSTPHCALGSEAANPFAPMEDGDTDPQTLSVAFGVCFKDPRVGNINDNPDTKFDETKVYNYLPQYMKMVCNP